MPHPPDVHLSDAALTATSDVDLRLRLQNSSLEGRLDGALLHFDILRNLVIHATTTHLAIGVCQQSFADKCEPILSFKKCNHMEYFDKYAIESNGCKYVESNKKHN